MVASMMPFLVFYGHYVAETSVLYVYKNLELLLHQPCLQIAASTLLGFLALEVAMPVFLYVVTLSWR